MVNRESGQGWSCKATVMSEGDMERALRRIAVEAQVTVDIGGQSIVSVVTVDSVKNLGIAVGSEVVAVIKADSVMLGVE